MFVLVLHGTCYSCRVTETAVAAQQKYVLRRCIDFTEWSYSGQTLGQEHEVVFFNNAEIVTA